MVHIICIVHGTNHVVEKVRDIFPGINILVNNEKNMFLKATHRITMTAYKNIHKKFTLLHISACMLFRC